MAETVAAARQAIDQGLQLHRQGRLAEAERLYTAVLSQQPNQFDALHLLGLLRHQQNRPAEAVLLIKRALDANPRSVAALADYGLVLQQLGRVQEAVDCLRKAVALAPGNADLIMTLGDALLAFGRPDEALQTYDRVLAINPNDPMVAFNRGYALLQLGRFGEALSSYDRHLSIHPGDAEALNNRGNVLRKLNRHEDAITDYDRALTLQPRYVEAFNNRGLALYELHRTSAAIESFDRALALRPDYPLAFNNRGNALSSLMRYAEAVSDYERAIALNPDYADAHFNRAGALSELKRHEDAVSSFERGLALEPGHPHAYGGLATSALTVCDWTRVARLKTLAEDHVRHRKSVIGPLALVHLCDDPALHLACARNYTAFHVPQPLPPMHAAVSGADRRIRLAYVSADFCRHATAHLAAGLFEQHDRSRFDVLGVSLGPDDNSDMRARLVSAFDDFHDARAKSDDDVAKLIRNLDIDIAVAMTERRPRIFAARPAPIQVCYLVFPGTTGGDFYDYVLADSTVLPFDQQPYFSEKIVHLPASYQINDSKRAIAPLTFGRKEAGLPEDGFVFCCFNNPAKIAAGMFDVWMSLLRAKEKAVLWLLSDEAATETNLRKEAAARGVDPSRLVFAHRLAPPEHLARHKLADLFLDTLPYNAHTTASDALFAGLPVLTCSGRSFAGRVGASLLHAVGLPDLVTHSLVDYEGLALRLAGDPSALRSLREKLQQNRDTQPLFDTARTTRNIEAAYMRMWDIAKSGQQPASFAVADR
jgi:protein O-GlcNAc transferase